MQGLEYLSKVEKESMDLAQKLIKATSEEEVSQILNEHNHQMNVFEARNEQSKSQQLESFKAKLYSRRNRRGNKKVFYPMSFKNILSYFDVLFQGRACDSSERDIQQDIVVAITEERIEVANNVIEENEEVMTTLCGKVADTMADILTSLVSEGAIPVEEGEELSKHYSEQNATILKRVSDIKNKQFRRLNERMADRKRRKLTALREKQEVEKKKVKILCFVTVQD